MTQLAGEQPISPSFSDRCKRAFLGRPMITDQLQHERLSNPVALGVLSPDAISSTAYGSEQVMIELLPAAGMAAFALLLPITGVILLILVLVAASYRQVVMVYTRAGGSYVVARENFGPKIAQIAAASLLIDYVVTVAVQCAAGTVAVASAIPALGPYSLEITVGMVLIMCFANLRGLREAGLPFALPTYFFVGHGLVDDCRRHYSGILLGFTGIRPGAHRWSGAGASRQRLIMGATVLIVLRAFANGGSSLTGVEAISNTVNAFRKPEGINARRVLTVMACVLAFLLAGVAWLAHVTHATPYVDGYPSMLSEIGRAVFGNGMIGNLLYLLMQAATAAILYTGGNTSFNGFPALASFVAEDSFLPRPLTKRGHRLVFSNGIITLTVVAVALLIVTGRLAQRIGAVLRDRGVHRLLDGRLRHDQTLADPSWARLAIQAGDQPVGGDLVDDRGGHLRDRQVHRRGLAGRRCLPDSGVRVDAAQPAVSRRGVGVGDVACGRVPT